ncbi:MAG: hypothetical protein LOY00_16210, partial [Methylocaldum sp.]|nr:hypothetical protein [Methylocaldum sp.]
ASMHQKSPMNPERPALHQSHLLGEAATHPIARRAGHLAALLLLAGDYPAAASRLASRPARRTLRHVQLPFLG